MAWSDSMVALRLPLPFRFHNWPVGELQNKVKPEVEKGVRCYASYPLRKLYLSMSIYLSMDLVNSDKDIDMY